MKLLQFKLSLCFLFLCFSLSALSQEQKANPVQRYDELIKERAERTSEEKQNIPTASPQNNKKTAVIEKDELTLLLPKLDNVLYQNWMLAGESEISIAETNEIINECGFEKKLKQAYKKEDHIVEVIIYKFKDFTGAYSIYTALHSGASTKLKVGKNASESEKLVNFWKGNYFVDIHTTADNDSIGKEFVILASQDISKNIQSDQLPPVVAIQLPALNRVQGSEKYCLSTLCCKEYISKDIPKFDCDNFKLQESGGIIKAGYQLSDDKKERIILVLTRYTSKENAQSVFNTLKEDFENKKKENKEMDIDVDINDSIVKIKNKKNDYTMLKQEGNLLAIAYFITSKKAGEQILGLVPWPIEINAPALKN